MKETKAERIYRDTRSECKSHIKAWGYQEGTGFTGLATREDDHICKRTLNAIQKLLDNDRAWLKVDRELGVSSEEEATEKEHLYNMIQATLDNEARGWGF